MQAMQALDSTRFPHGRLGFLVNQARNAMLNAIDDELAPLGVTATQYIVLMGVADNHAQTPTELCKLLGCDSGAMTRLLDRIERKGMVRRTRNHEDRRTVRIVLTSKGDEICPLLRQAAGRVHDKIVAEFSGDDMALFHHFLQRVAASAGAKNFK